MKIYILIVFWVQVVSFFLNSIALVLGDTDTKIRALVSMVIVSPFMVWGGFLLWGVA